MDQDPAAGNNVIEVRLFGGLSVRRSNTPIGFAYKKVAALFSMLCTTSRELSRAHLEATLWPEKAEEEASRNLRNALTMVRRVLRDTGDAMPLLSTKKTVQLVESATLSVDAQQFEVRAPRDIPPGNQAQGLERALSLYQGRFLSGFSLPDCPAFEAWRDMQSERFHTEAVGMCGQLLSLYEAQADIENAAMTAARLVALSPLDERGHGSLIYWTARAGDRSGALSLYERFAETLADEFGTEPSTALQAMAHDLRESRAPHGLVAVLPRAVAATPASPSDLVAVYVHVVHRDEDPEATFEAMAEVHGLLRQEALRWGGHVARHPFGGMVAFFHAGDGADQLSRRVAGWLMAMHAVAQERPECAVAAGVVADRLCDGSSDEFARTIERMGADGFRWASRRGGPWCVTNEAARRLLRGALAFDDATEPDAEGGHRVARPGWCNPISKL